MKQLLPSEEIFEDYLHPMLFWGIFFLIPEIYKEGGEERKERRQSARR
jgi:hypothetical protein